ncbi:MAG: hypothetical protein ABL995_20835 [Bryobacteraceae bacterium]
MERQPAETMGIDLGDKLSQYVILNEDGLAVEEGSFRNQVASIAKHFGKRGRMRIALEVGTQSAWIARELNKLGYEVTNGGSQQIFHFLTRWRFIGLRQRQLAFRGNVRDCE